MLTEHINPDSTPVVPPVGLAPEETSWYAVHTMARHEKRVAWQLQEKNVRTFLPLLQESHRWSDRQSKVEVPLFSCYAFVCIVPVVENRAQVLRTPGVLGFVGSQGQGTPIPDNEIESLQTAITNKVPLVAHCFINAGKRVRIRGGSLDGIEGILIRQGEDQSLVVSMDLLQRSVSIRVEGYNMEFI